MTNLCFTGVCVSTNGVTLDVAWPTNMFPAGTTLDFFARHHALTNAWRWLFARRTQPGETNASLSADMPVDLAAQTAPAAMFFKVQDRSSCATSMSDSDGDGIPDVFELHNGTNPYDGGSFRLRTVVTYADADRQAAVTNHLVIAGEGPGLDVAFTESGALAVDAVVTNGVCVVNCWRDFNGNGAYDEGVDVLYSRTLAKADNGKAVSASIGDADGDGQADSSELVHGTDPQDAGNYCFNLAFVETGVFGAAAQLTAEVLFGTNVLVGPVVMTNRSWECDLGHLVASNREAVVAYFWDDANANGVREADERSTLQHFTIRGHENVLTNTLSMGAFDRDNDGMPDRWETLHADAGLSPTNAADAFLDFDSDGLINLHEYWAGCDPVVPDGSNTLFSVCSRSIDDRIRNVIPSNVVDRFVDFFENGDDCIFIANTNFWLRDVDVSCVSVWNNGDEHGSMAATAITHRHVIMAAHWTAGRYYFCTANGQVITRTVGLTYTIPGSDLLLGRLDADLPETIQLPMVLNEELLDSIAGCKYLPSVCINQRKAATILELDSLNCSQMSSNGYTYRLLGRTSATNVVSHARSEMRGATVDGNSGCPVFLVAADRLIFLFSKHLGYRNVSTWTPTWGPVFSYRLTEVQNKINEWEGPEAGEYQIEVFHGFGAEDPISGGIR